MVIPGRRAGKLAQPLDQRFQGSNHIGVIPGRGRARADERLGASVRRAHYNLAALGARFARQRGVVVACVRRPGMTDPSEHVQFHGISHTRCSGAAHDCIVNNNRQQYGAAPRIPSVVFRMDAPPIAADLHEMLYRIQAGVYSCLPLSDAKKPAQFRPAWRNDQGYRITSILLYTCQIFLFIRPPGMNADQYCRVRSITLRSGRSSEKAV